jgi:hypothetical protein
MTIKEIKSFFDFITNKYQLGYVSGDEFNRLWRISELSHMDSLLGKEQQFSQGRPVPRWGLDVTKRNVEGLAPFRYTITVNSGASGEISKMTDVAAIETVNKTDGTKLQFVSPNRLSYILNSSVWNITDQPVYAEYDTYYRTYPENISVVITAIKTPPFSKWAYIFIDENEVYDNLNSVDPIWKSTDCIEIIGRMCKHVGVSLKDGELVQYGQSIINQGE